MDVFNQLVHVALVARWTTIPVAFRNLFLEVFFVEARIDRGTGDIA